MDILQLWDGQTHVISESSFSAASSTYMVEVSIEYCQVGSGSQQKLKQAVAEIHTRCQAHNRIGNRAMLAKSETRKGCAR